MWLVACRLLFVVWWLACVAGHVCALVVIRCLFGVARCVLIVVLLFVVCCVCCLSFAACHLFVCCSMCWRSLLVVRCSLFVAGCLGCVVCVSGLLVVRCVPSDVICERFVVVLCCCLLALCLLFVVRC